MKTLTEHNEEFWDLEKKLREQKADVMCDKCGTEMLYDGFGVCATSPPKRRVHCPHCKESGYKMGSA